MKKNISQFFRFLHFRNNFFVAILILAVSCKKQHEVVALTPDLTKRVSRIELNNIPMVKFSYDEAGRLQEQIEGDYKITYNHSGSGFSYKSYSKGILSSEGDGNSITNGRLTSVFCQQYHQGTPTSSYNFSFLYNTEGNLISFTEGSNKYELTYTNGDFISASQKMDGISVSSTTYEYYSAIVSKFNLPLMEYYFEFPFLTESLIGSPNKHLMKKVTEVRDGNVYVTAFTYELDASGYVKSYNQVYQKNNDVPVSSTYIVFY